MPMFRYKPVYSKMNLLIFFITLMSANGLEDQSNPNFINNGTSPLIRNKRYVAHINPLYRKFDFMKRDGK